MATRVARRREAPPCSPSQISTVPDLTITLPAAIAIAVADRRRKRA